MKAWYFLDRGISIFMLLMRKPGSCAGSTTLEMQSTQSRHFMVRASLPPHEADKSTHWNPVRVSSVGKSPYPPVEWLRHRMEAGLIPRPRSVLILVDPHLKANL